MSSDYRLFILKVRDTEQSEVLLSMLSDLPFDGFSEEADGWHAYLPLSADQKAVQQQLEVFQARIPFTFEEKLLPGQNWNATWEANFQPILVENTCYVRAAFHPKGPAGLPELEIDPRMAFGTGHHATTYLMLQLIGEHELQGMELFDYGCGTGILAIFAAMRGAKSVFGVDIEANAVENSILNATLNGHPGLPFQEGTIDLVEGQTFDGILANINRRVIIDTLPGMIKLVRKGGFIWLSGILQEDLHLVLHRLEELGLEAAEVRKRDEWTAIVVNL